MHAFQIYSSCNSILNKGSVWAYNSDLVNTRIIFFCIKWSLVRLVLHVLPPCSNTMHKMRFDQCIVNGHERFSIQELPCSYLYTYSFCNFIAYIIHVFLPGHSVIYNNSKKFIFTYTLNHMAINA